MSRESKIEERLHQAWKRLEEAEGILKFLAKNEVSLSRPMNIDWERSDGGVHSKCFNSGRLSRDYCKKYNLIDTSSKMGKE